ncbi:uncharacterized protein LOC135822310 [Sycon ciliatum]|uniref:uncharacterized protein LOC135822310 n=1 Tax=Sycon ciliatum TaxID=27933 RepID=UPI0031F71F75
MSLVPLSSIATFFSGEPRLIQRGENAHSSNRVESFLFHHELGHITAKIHASMKDKRYDVEIELGSEGGVVRASCTCPKGQGRCHHMAAALVYANKNVSSTDRECSWTVRKGTSETKTVDGIFPKSKPFCAISRPVDNEDRAWFHHQLGTLDRWKGFRWLLDPEVKEADNLPTETVEGITLSQGFLEAEHKVTYVCTRLSVSAAQIVAVEKATHGQNSNATWSLLRKGRITASNFGPVLKTISSGRQPSKSLFTRLLGQYDLSGQKAIQWGLMHESTAVACYEECEYVSVRSSGLWLAPCGLIGGSPDGVVSETKLIEVKCPYSARSTSLAAMAKEKTFFLSVSSSSPANFSLDLSTESGWNYFHQIQGNLCLTGREVCDLVVWTPLETVIIPIRADPTWSGNLARIEEFYKTFFLPVFLDGGV